MSSIPGRSPRLERLPAREIGQRIQPHTSTSGASRAGRWRRGGQRLAAPFDVPPTHGTATILSSSFLRLVSHRDEDFDHHRGLWGGARCTNSTLVKSFLACFAMRLPEIIGSLR